MFSVVVGSDEGEVSSVGCGSLGDFAKALVRGGKYLEARTGRLLSKEHQKISQKNLDHPTTRSI